MYLIEGREQRVCVLRVLQAPRNGLSHARHLHAALVAGATPRLASFGAQALSNALCAAGGMHSVATRCGVRREK